MGAARSAGRPASALQLRRAAFLCTLALLCGSSCGQDWQTGRATFYGGPENFLSNFADRGPPPEYGFGNVVYGSCGYLNKADGNANSTLADLPFPKDTVAALANVAQDYPGSCGRCYEVRCVNGEVIANGTQYYRTDQGYNLPQHAPNATDTYGRTWPGNPLASDNLQFVRCWNSSAGSSSDASSNASSSGSPPSIFITVTDNCPCVQTNANTGAVEGSNPPCCGSVNHFDLSYWGFEKLAHPLYGIMTLQFRPVDCYTKTPLTYLPGFVNTTIYGDRPETGWAWFVYGESSDQFSQPGAGLGGSAATCINIGGNPGGLTFACRECGRSGYQPFTRGTKVSFWVKNQQGSGVPALTVSAGDYDNKKYCSSSALSSLTPSAKQGDWSQFTVPISSFACPFPASAITQLGFQNTGSQAVSFCMDDVKITS